VSPETSLGWRQHVDDLHALVDHWQIDKATIIGHSWGALLGLIFATQHPGRVRRMLLVTPASVNSEFRNSYLEELNRRTVDLGIIHKQRDLIRSDLRKHRPDQFRQRAFRLSLEPFLKNPNKTIGVQPFFISHRGRAALWRSLGEYDLTEGLSKLSVEALVIHGRHDLIPLDSSRKIANLLGARLEVFDNSGHLPFFEEHELFLEISEEFLRTEDS
jgi:proline iminopeptidase